MSGPYILKKAGPEMFSFCVNNIFAEKQVLFEICGPMQSQQSSNEREYVTEVNMDSIRIGCPAGYLRFFGSGLDLDIYF